MTLKSKYLADGFLSPVRIVYSGETPQVWADYCKFVQLFGINGKLEGDKRFRIHLVAPWAYRLVTHPTLVSAVQDVLGNKNILCWSSDLNIKDQNSPGYFSWHQDSTYSGLDPPESVVTAWVALSPSNQLSGCLQFLPSSHLAGQLNHQETVDGSNLLSLGQTIPHQMVQRLQDQTGVFQAELEPGEASFHHWRCVHCSGANNSPKDRVGLAIRFMTSDVRNTKGVTKERVTLVSGELGDHWDLEPKPQVEYGDREWKEHQISMEREKKNYFKGKEIKGFK